MTAPKPLEAIDVECPKCKARPGRECMNATVGIRWHAVGEYDMAERKPHAARLRRASMDLTRALAEMRKP